MVWPLTTYFWWPSHPRMTKKWKKIVLASCTPTSEKTSDSASLSKVTSIAGLRMFVAFLVFATASGKWISLLARSSYTYFWWPPHHIYKITFSKKNPWKNLLESEKTSNSASLSKVTSIAGLRMFVAFFVFATAPGMWMRMLVVSSYRRIGHTPPFTCRTLLQKVFIGGSGIQRHSHGGSFCKN